MVFGKHINKFYLKYLFFFIAGILALIVVDYAQTAIPRLVGMIIDTTNEAVIVEKSELGKILLQILLYAGLDFGFRVIWRLCIMYEANRIQKDLREEMFNKALTLSSTYYQDNKVGTIMAWFTTDIETIGEWFSWGTVGLIDGIFLTALVIIRMVNVNPYLTLIAIIPMVLIIVWSLLIDRFFEKTWEDRQKAFDELYDFANENFTGIRVIKAFVKENKEFFAFQKIAKKNQGINFKMGMLDASFHIVITIIIGVIFSMCIGFGGYFTYMTATGQTATLFNHEIKLTVGQLFTFVSLFSSLIWPMIAIGHVFPQRARCVASLKRISNFLDAEVDVKSPENAVVFDKVEGNIEFRNFTFKYSKDGDEILKDINITIKAGETIGVVGKIGSGKTTLASVLLRQYNFEKGTLFIDGVDLMDADLHSLRSNISYAPQDNFLFSDTIENNVSFVVDTPNLERVIESTMFSDVHENIDEFPNKYETVTGERGVTLSGGQKQRISLARAFYRNAPIMIMDDTVSAVDVKTEETILKNIKEKRNGLTTIVIASRVSTVQHFDKILVLVDGKVEAFDSHENLLKTSPVYQRMVYLQQLEAEILDSEKGGNSNE